jgi:hypothetical protein
VFPEADDELTYALTAKACRTAARRSLFGASNDACVDAPRRAFCSGVNVDQTPSPVQKLLYLSGRAAPNEHRGWIHGVLRMQSPRRLGMLLALPNALILIVVAVVSILLGDKRGLAIFVAGAALVMITGALVPALSRARSAKLASKNGLAPL